MQVRSDAILRQWRQIPGGDTYSVAVWAYEFRIPHTDDDLGSWIWAHVARDVTGGVRCIGMNHSAFLRTPVATADVQRTIVNTTMPYALTEINPHGKQLSVCLRRGSFPG